MGRFFFFSVMFIDCKEMKNVYLENKLIFLEFMSGYFLVNVLCFMRSRYY